MTEIKNKQDYKAQHKKEVIWQIWLPVGFGAAAMLSLGLLAIFSLQSGSDASARWGDVAAIWVLLPVFVVGIIILSVLALLIFGVVKLTSILPAYSALAQYYIRLLSSKIQNLADRSAKPVIQTKSAGAAANRFWLALRYLIMGGYSDNH